MAKRWTTRPEPELHRALGVSDAEGARAKAVFSAVEALFLPFELRVAVLAKLLESPLIEVGETYAARMLALGPITHLGTLLDADGVGMRRLSGVTRVLATHDPAALTPPAAAAPETESTKSLRSGDAGAMRLTDIASSAGEQLDAAHVGLQRARHPLSLGDVEITLRGSFAADEDQHLAMRFDAEQRSPEAASELVLRYDARAPTQTLDAETTVPDVRGYTRALAERKLRAAGLGATTVHVLTDAPGSAGRVVRQRPAPGAPLPSGRVVTLQLGRPSSTGSLRT